MGAKALIFGSCPCESWDFLAPYSRWPDLVIAADGGLALARTAGFTPHVYVGDGDSGGAPEPGLTCVTLPVEKDVTDLEAAYQWARDHGAEQVIFTGCTGGRLDHYLAAMGILETAAREGVHGLLLSPGNRAEVLLPGTRTFRNTGYRYFSLIPLDQTLEDLEIRGAKYELDRCQVRRGKSLTVSNEFSCGDVTVSFRKGCCYLLMTN